MHGVHLHSSVRLHGMVFMHRFFSTSNMVEVALVVRSLCLRMESGQLWGGGNLTSRGSPRFTKVRIAKFRSSEPSPEERVLRL